MHTASAVGIPSKTSWSTTALRRTDQGELYLVIGVSGSEEAPHVGRAFVRAVEEFPLASAGAIYQALTTHLKSLPPEVAVSLSALYRQESKMTFMTFGFGITGLLRKGQPRWLIPGTQENQVLEGSVQPEDRIFLGTARVKELELPLADWTDLGTDEIGAELVGRFQKVENSGEVAMLVVREPKTQSDVAGPAAPMSPEQPGDGEPNGALFPPTPLAAPASRPTHSLPQYDSSKHLIPPEKLQAGIRATQADQTERWKERWSTDRLAQAVEAIRQLSWLKIALFVGIIFAVVGGLFAWRTWRIQQEYQAVIVPLEELVQQAQQYPAEQRLQQRDTARSLLERLQATRVNNRANRVRLQELIARTETLYTDISGERDVVNLPVFYDFRLVASDFLATRGDRFEDQAVFFDPNGQKIISLNLNNKSNQTVTNESLANSADLAAADSLAYVLRSDSIQRVPLGGASITQLSEISIPEPAYLDRFAENLYVFSRGNQQLWRLSLDSESDASPSAWVRSAPGIDFSRVSSVSIDGSVWMGSSTGDIFKLTRGEREPFSVQGLLEPFTSTLLVAAVEDGNRLAVVEPAANRLIILGKDGVYQQQVRSEQIGGVTDVFWDDAERAVYLIAGSVVYKVDL